MHYLFRSRIKRFLYFCQSRIAHGPFLFETSTLPNKSFRKLRKRNLPFLLLKYPLLPTVCFFIICYLSSIFNFSSLFHLIALLILQTSTLLPYKKVCSIDPFLVSFHCSVSTRISFSLITSIIFPCKELSVKKDTFYRTTFTLVLVIDDFLILTNF